jgi:hypothetical protein
MQRLSNERNILLARELCHAGYKNLRPFRWVCNRPLVLALDITNAVVDFLIRECLSCHCTQRSDEGACVRIRTRSDGLRVCRAGGNADLGRGSMSFSH